MFCVELPDPAALPYLPTASIATLLASPLSSCFSFGLAKCSCQSTSCFVASAREQCSSTLSGTSTSCVGGQASYTVSVWGLLSTALTGVQPDVPYDTRPHCHIVDGVVTDAMEPRSAELNVCATRELHFGTRTGWTVSALAFQCTSAATTLHIPFALPMRDQGRTESLPKQHLALPARHALSLLQRHWLPG